MNASGLKAVLYNLASEEKQASVVPWLLDVGALIPDEETNAQRRNTVGAQHRGFMFKITRHGLDMLRGT